MLGLPLAPCHEFPENAPAIFLSAHALHDAGIKEKFATFARSGRPMIVTDGFAKEMTGMAECGLKNVKIIKVNGSPKSLLELTEAEANQLRAPLLNALKANLEAPVGVAPYLFEDGSWVLENFNDEAAKVKWNGREKEIAGRSWDMEWKQ
jgi:hypothetical protein